MIDAGARRGAGITGLLRRLLVGPPDAGLRLVLRHTEPAVRAQDVITGLERVAGLVLGRPLLTRLAQGPLAADGTVGDPLAL